MPGTVIINQPNVTLFSGSTQVGVNGNPIVLTGSVNSDLRVSGNLVSSTNPIPFTMNSGSYGGKVEGIVSDGSPISGNPVLVGGIDANNNAQSLLLDTQGRIVTAPAGSVSTTNGFSFGDIAMSAISSSAIRRTSYLEQTSNAVRSLKSANANDHTSGSGAQRVKIIYLDVSGSGPYTEILNLSGTTAVNTSGSNICYIEEMEVIRVGGNGSNVGIITLTAATGGLGNTIGTIAASDNRTFWAHHYTPAGKTTFVTSISVVINGGAGIFFLRSILINVSGAVDQQVSDFVRESAQSATSTRNYGTPIQISGSARSVLWVTSEAGTSLTYRGSFDFYDE